MAVMILPLEDDHAKHGQNESKDQSRFRSINDHEGGKKNSCVNRTKFKQKRGFIHEQEKENEVGARIDRSVKRFQGKP